MTKYVGIKNNKISIVSNTNFSNKDLEVVELPQELEDVLIEDLIINYKYQNNQFINKNGKREAKDLKVAFVGNWAFECGLATYNYYLFPEIANYVKDIKLFIEENPNPVGSILSFGNKTLTRDKIVQCWKRGDSLQNLVNELKSYNPDIILISHEFGLFPNARHWMSALTQLSDYRVITIMHSIFPEHKDKTIVEAIMPEIVVHLEQASDCLKNVKKVNGKVHLIPHGCYPCNDPNPLWNYYKSNHTFIQAGFGFEYKRFEESIKAVSILKEEYEDVFLTILFSESPLCKIEHKRYYDKLIDLIQELQLNANVCILRGFQSDEIIDSFMRTNKVCVLPYGSNPGHEVYGASGYARLAMSKAIPVITSSIPHFSDLCTIKADNHEEIAYEIDKLFSNEELRKQQIELQLNFIEKNSWSNIAKKYISIFENRK